ncbi:MAG: hypothetical protein II037_01360, partial [Bacteroidales bacterium]|nr:hypothetical protein [Bacteroidales bacterium]
IKEKSTKVTNKERESVEELLTVEEKLYLLRKKINEEREKQELPSLEKVTVKVKEMADMTDILNDRLQSALHIIQYEYTKAVNEATTAEEKSKLAKEQQRKEIELQIEYSKRMLETLPPQTDEWYKMAKAIEDYRKQLGDLNKYEEPEWLKKANERIEATLDMVNEINNYAQTVSDFQLQRLQEQDEAYDAEYERQKEYINNTVLSEEEKNKKLEELDRQKTAHDKAVAKERAEIERRKAIFDASVQAAQAISHAVGSVGELLATSAGGDAYSAVARYIAAIAAGATAVATVISLVSQMISIPQYAKGGTAEANKPFIAGEKGREIGFGMRTGKVYDFSKPTLFKANEPISIKNAQETKQIINNNTEYNKDVTLKNTIMVKVIDNARVVKYFKL